MRRIARVCVFAVTVLASADRAPAGDLSIPYAVTRDGRVSLAIYDRQGRLVRTLLTGASRGAGNYVATWDGLDRYGQPLPAGEYTWKMLATAGLRAEFLLQVGQNVDPPWEHATGNHEAPSGAAIDATGLYRVGATNEGAHWGVKTDLDGRHLWTNDRWAADPWAHGTVAVALVGGRLFELMPNGDTYGYDAATGRLFTGGDFDPKPWDLCWKFEFRAGLKDDEKRKLRMAESPSDLAGDPAGELLVAAFPQHDAIAWFSAKDGRLVDSAAGLADLAGVAVGKDGTVLAISRGAVVAVARSDKSQRIVIPADRLDGPWRLCVSRQSGDIYVAENGDLARGKAVKPRPDASDGKVPDLAQGVKIAGAPARRHHQVKRFSAGGEFVKSYGRPEGRGDGIYVPTDFRGLTDIEAGPDGGFLITEGHHTPPRRSARFDADGKLLREWCGAQHYGILACPEPADPRFVWTMANAGRCALVRWEVDYAARSWRVAEIYQDVFSANRYSRVPAVPYVFAHGGRTYIQGGAVQPSGLSLAIYDPAAKRMRPCNACETIEENGKKRTYLWNDLDDDGLASGDEIQWLDRPKLGGHVTADDLTFVTTSTASDYSPGPILRPSRITAGGTPVYEFRKAADYGPWEEDDWRKYPGDIRRAADGSWYACFSEATRNPNEGCENHGAWYYNSCSAIDRLVKWDRDFRPLWSVGRHSPDIDHETGSTAMPRGIVGFTHGCVVWGDASDEECARPTVWTEDGLYVDELLRVPIDNVPKGAYGMTNTNEYPQGHLFTNPKSGEVLYYAISSAGGSPIYRISGWENWQRAGGAVTLAARALKTSRRNGSGLKAEYFNGPECSGAPALTRTDPLIYFNWGKGAPDPAITAQMFCVRWSGTYEAATGEETRFEIHGSFPWRDEGRPLWSRLWLGGQLVFESKPPGGRAGSTYDQQAAGGVGAVRVKLRAGERIDLRMECGFKKGKAAIALSRDTPGLDRRAVLPAFFHPEPGPRRLVEVVDEKRPEVIADISFEEKDGFLSRSGAGGDVFGRLTGTARRVPGKTGMGIELEGKGKFRPALFPIDEDLRLPDENYTIAFWFTTTAKDVRLCEATRYSSYNNRWSDHVVSVAGGKVRFHVQGDDILETADTFDDGRWHHVATTVGKGGQRLYVDGTLIAKGRLSVRTRTGNRLGLDLGPGGETAVVGLDELKVCGRALDTAEIERLARRP